MEDPNKGVIIQNLQEIAVSESQDLQDLVALGNQRRFVANTGINLFSSRSHAILIFNIEGTKFTEQYQKITINSKLQMVDLAGSERVANT